MVFSEEDLNEQITDILTKGLLQFQLKVIHSC